MTAAQGLGLAAILLALAVGILITALAEAQRKLDRLTGRFTDDLSAARAGDRPFAGAFDPFPPIPVPRRQHGWDRSRTW